MTNPPKRPDPELLHRFAASQRWWANMLAAFWIAVHTRWRSKLPRAARIMFAWIVRDVFAAVRTLIVLIALSHDKRRRPLARLHRPRGAPRGFRHTHRNFGAIRRARRVVTLRGLTPGQRLNWIRYVFHRLRVWTARAVKRIETLGVRPRLLCVAPVAAVCVSIAAPTPCCADTS